MNKKFLFGMFAAAGMLLATSCQNDELDLGQSGNQATVSFTLGVEGGVQTRAISDASGANLLKYAVFDKDGNYLSGIDTPDANVSTWPHTVNLTLAKGQTYNVVFWAQNSECTAYTVTDDMQLTVDYSQANNNDEKRDAFFKSVELVVTGSQTEDVVLKRPFAQINVGVYNDDWDAAVASGIEIQTSKVIIKNAAANMNLLDGSVSNAVEVTYDFGTIPAQFENADGTSAAETLEVDTDGDGQKEPYKYLSMSYILVHDTDGGTKSALLEDVYFAFHPETGNDIVLEEGLNNVPVQRNWRTNIIGKFLTGDVQLNIVIDENYDGENNGLPWEKTSGVRAGEKYYESLAAALNAGETNIQLADGEYTLEGLTIKQDVTIVGASTNAKILKGTGNLGGHNATFENVTIVTPNTNYNGLQHAGNVTLNGCVIENTYWCYSETGNKTVFNNCTFKQTDGTIYNVWTYGSNVDFNNCEFYCAGKSVLVYTEGGDVWETVNFKNCKFYASAPANDGKAAIEIDSSLNPCNVNIEGCTAEGFDLGSVSGNSLYNLKKGEMGVNCHITVDGKTLGNANVVEIEGLAALESLSESVNAGNSYEGKVITLMTDIDLGGETWASIGTREKPFKGSFDGNGKTIKNLTGTNGLIGAMQRPADGSRNVVKNLTIENVTIDDAQGKAHISAFVGHADGTQLELEGLTLKGTVKIKTICNVGGVLASNPNGAIYAKNITVDVTEDSYIDVTANPGYYEYTGGVFGQVWGSSVENVTSNINIIAKWGYGVGGVSGGATGTWTNISCSGDVTVTDVDEAKWYTNTDPNGNSYGDVYYWQGSGKIIGYHGGVTYTNCTSTGTLKIGDKTSNGLYFYNSAGEKVEDSRFGCSRWNSDNNVTIND